MTSSPARRRVCFAACGLFLIAPLVLPACGDTAGGEGSESDAGASCSGCEIDGLCYPEGTTDPSNGCSICQPARSPTSWTDNDGVGCDDGLFCTVGDSCSQGTCTGEARPCDDGVACNGTESCEEDADRCASGELQCASAEICDVLVDRCVSACSGCVIEGTCYGDGQRHPTNPCRACDPDSSASQWTDDDGADCNDGLFCTVDDTCSAGSCAGTPNGCDDGVACNGVESCDDTADACVAGAVTCGDDEVCDVIADACVATCTGCVIDGVCYGEGSLDPANPCQRCDTATSAAAWSDNDGVPCDDGFFCTVDDVCSAGACDGTDWDCDDGVACNGAESCDDTGDACVAGVVTCGDDEVCDVAVDTCVVTCTGCVIGGVCYGEGSLDPANSCQRCDTALSTTAWSDNDGAPCDDGFFCTVDDVCSAGACDGTDWDCDDGVACNGAESCDDTDDACVAGAVTCGDDEVCDVIADACVATCTGCVIDGVCYGEGSLDPANPCQRCDTATSAAAWSDNDGAPCDDGFFCTVDDVCSAGACDGTDWDCDDGVACNGAESCDDTGDACVAGVVTCGDDEVCDVAVDTCVVTCTGCVIGGVCYGEGSLDPANSCQRCDTALSTTAWSDNDGAPCDDGFFCTVDDVCSAGACDGTDWDCDDGVACNGAESCDDTGDACVAGVVTCGDDEVCDVAVDACVVTCTGCVIGGVCYGEGSLDPANSCQRCDTALSTTAWSDNDGAPCDDGFFCTVDDVCSAGACDGTDWDCDDGVACNGAESCDDTDDACVAGAVTCGDDEVCDVMADACVATCTGCVIDGVCYGEGSLDPANSCQRCDTALSTTAWSDNDGAPCDDGFFCTVDDVCSAGACDGTDWDCDDGVACNGAESCDDTDDACVAGAVTCGDDEVCDVMADACVATCTGCVIADVCYGEGQVDPSNPCRICDPQASSSAWTPTPGAPCDDGSDCTPVDSCIDFLGNVRCVGVVLCSDAIACNGLETCNGAGSCEPGVSPCGAGEVCDVASDACVVVCAGCVIGDLCYGDGQVNPSTPCQVCDVATATDAWSPNDGASCDDGVFCNGIERCVGVACELAVTAPCTYVGELCWEDGEQCCEADASAACLGDQANTYDSCGRLSASVDCAALGEHHTCIAGACECSAGWTGADCSRCLIYVDGSLPDYTGHDGTTWALALRTVQEGINAAQAGGGCEVWVARGTYHPTEDVDGNPSSDVTASIHMATGVDLYGGFQGTELRREQRDAGLFRTILDGRLPITLERVCHVMVGADGAVLDGFVISSGQALCDSVLDAADCHSEPDDTWCHGGGLLNDAVSPTIRNCRFEYNDAYYGGGMANINGAAPLVTDCLFLSNQAVEILAFPSDYAGEGGGIWGGGDIASTEFEGNVARLGGGLYSRGALVTSSTFEANVAGWGGGAYVNDLAVIVDSDFAQNTAENYGGGAAVWSGSVFGGLFSGNTSFRGGGVWLAEEGTVDDVAFLGNSASQGGGVFHDGGAMSGCVFEQNLATETGGGLFVGSASSGSIESCDFRDNQAELYGGGIYNGSWARRVFVNCLIEANAAGVDGGGVYNTGNLELAAGSGPYALSSAAFINCDVVGNTAAERGGGLYNEQSDLRIVNSTFRDNAVTLDPNGRGGGLMDVSGLIGIVNTIVWGNTAGSDPQIAFAYGPRGVTYSAVQDELFPGDGNIELSVSPFEGDTSALAPDSPCVDSANDAAAVYADIQGRARVDQPPFDAPFGDGWYVDMGAHERSTLPCSSVRVYSPGDGSRDALYWAPSCFTMSWDMAETYCAHYGGHLAGISSQGENDRVRTLLGGLSWIGGRAVGGVWSWADGALWSYANWADGQPDGTNQCAAMFASDGTWADYPCTGSGSYVCEQDVPRCAPDCAGNSCAAANRIGALPFTAFGSTFGRVDNFDDVAGVCIPEGAYAGSPDVVWAFTPTSDGSFTFSVTPPGFGSGGFNVVLYLLTTCVEGPIASCVAGVNDGSYGESLTVDLAGGTTYYLIIDGFFPGSEGYYALDVVQN